MRLRRVMAGLAIATMSLAGFLTWVPEAASAAAVAPAPVCQQVDAGYVDVLLVLALLPAEPIPVVLPLVNPVVSPGEVFGMLGPYIRTGVDTVCPI